MEDKAYKLETVNGIEVYLIQAEKFKTNTINLFFLDNITKESASYNALLAAVLRRGSKKTPSLRDIALKLENLYGASFDCGVSKKGEYQLVQFYGNYVRENYVNAQQSLFRDLFTLLFDIVTDPIVVENGFNPEYTEQEKQNQCQLIESRINDKTQYAVDKCFELMCTNQPYSVYEYGDIETVKKIDPKKLYEHYKKMLETCPATLFLCGKFNDDDISWVTGELKKLKRQEIKNLNAISLAEPGKEIREITETMNISQGKLSLGYTTKISPTSDEYYSLIYLNGIFGGGAHSKLFQNVREKESLAYYAFSRLDRFKGLMVASSGIDAQNKDKAKAIIEEQMKAVKRGEITEYEFDSTSKSLKTSLESLKDNQMNMVDFYLSQKIVGTNDSIDEMAQKLAKVTKEQVVEVSKAITSELVYFLQGEEPQKEGKQ